MSVGANTPNELMVVFSNTVSAGFDAVQGAVTGVFGLMIALVVALTGIQWALSANREVLASGFGKVLLIGFFAYLINDWQQLSETLYAGFMELGLTAGGGSLSRAEFLNPGSILNQGWEIVKAIGETPRTVDNPLDVIGNLADALILGVAMIGILLAFALLALQIIVCLLEFKIVTLGGFILLPFGIWSKSAFLAERPLGYVVSSGLKVLALAIVVSGARTVFDQLQPSTEPDIYEALTILVASILLAMLAMFIPSLASALVTGGPALGAGAALTGGLAVGGAGVLAAAGIMGAGAAVGGGAARMAGTSRVAAGAGAGRGTTSGPPAGGASSCGPASGGGTGGRSSGAPRPSNDNRRSPGVAEPAADWTTDQPAADGSAAGAGQDAGQGSGEGSGQGGSETGASTGARSAAEKARADFHKAVATPASSRPGRRPAGPKGRSGALQAFFIANAGRGLMPSAETAGTLSPNLKTEEP